MKPIYCQSRHALTTTARSNFEYSIELRKSSRYKNKHVYGQYTCMLNYKGRLLLVVMYNLFSSSRPALPYLVSIFLLHSLHPDILQRPKRTISVKKARIFTWLHQSMQYFSEISCLS